MAACHCVESVNHIFWECSKVKPILSWINRFLQLHLGNNFHLDINLFLFGFPDINTTRTVFDRIWFVLCVTKFTLWKSRCIHVFQSKLQPTDVIISIIKKQIKDRIKADKVRYKNEKFKRVWLGRDSFVFTNQGEVFVNLP